MFILLSDKSAYYDDFEADYVRNAKVYYTSMAKIWLESGDILEYMKNVDFFFIFKFLK